MCSGLTLRQVSIMLSKSATKLAFRALRIFYCVLLQNHNYLVACQEVAVESKHIDCGYPIK